MKSRNFAGLCIAALAGLLSAFVSLHAAYSAYAMDWRASPVLTALYCIFPGLCFPLFLFMRSPRLQAAAQAALALGYLTTFSMLSWRTCSELGYCGSVTATVMTVLKARPSLAILAVVALSFVLLFLDRSVRKIENAPQSSERVLN